MPFRNDIVGGETLIRTGMRSANFSDTGEEAVRGWRVARDGSATFNNITVGQTEWTIDEDGNAVFANVSADSIVLDGENLSELIDRSGRGIIALYQLSGDSASNVGVTGVDDVNWAQINLDNVQERAYRISAHNLRIDKNGASPSFVSITGYVNFDTDPGTTNSERFLFWQDGQENTASSADDQIPLSTLIQPAAANAGTQMRMWLYFGANDAGVLIQASSFGPSYIVIEDMGPVREIATLDLSSLTPPTQQITRTYDATWTASWDVGDGKMSTERVYQGDFDGSSNRYGKIGFDDATIRSDLSGAVIDKIELRLTNEHTWFNDGWTVSQAHIGTHNNASEPSGSSSTSGTYSIDEFSWDKGQTKYVTLSNSIGEALRDNSAKGIAFGKTSGGTQGEYGYMTGANGSSSTIPRLRITYTK